MRSCGTPQRVRRPTTHLAMVRSKAVLAAAQAHRTRPPSDASLLR